MHRLASMKDIVKVRSHMDNMVIASSTRYIRVYPYAYLPLSYFTEYADEKEDNHIVCYREIVLEDSPATFLEFNIIFAHKHTVENVEYREEYNKILTKGFTGLDYIREPLIDLLIFDTNAIVSENSDLKDLLIFPGTYHTVIAPDSGLILAERYCTPDVYTLRFFIETIAFITGDVI